MKDPFPIITDLVDKDKLILSGPNAHVGLSVPKLIFEYGNPLGKMLDMPFMFHRMIRCLIESKKSYRDLESKYTNQTITTDQLNKLESYIKGLGVDQIAFTQVRPDIIFKDKGIVYPNAIVLTMAMEKEKIRQAPSVTTIQEIFRTYMNLGIYVNKIVKYMNELGFNAQAGPAIGGDVDYPVLASKAGLGYMGKHGLLITPDLGPSLRIAAVYTDITNLPYTDNNNHKWIEEFCNQCNQCVKNCPSGAIYQDSIVYEDGSKSCTDYTKCAIPFSNNHGCTVCIKSCVFFKSDYYKIKESYERISTR